MENTGKFLHAVSLAFGMIAVLFLAGQIYLGLKSQTGGEGCVGIIPLMMAAPTCALGLILSVVGNRLLGGTTKIGRIARWVNLVAFLPLLGLAVLVSV